jgi:AcrR family transcriptional regulator
MLETLRWGRALGYLRTGIDLETLADRLCQVLLHVSLGVFRDVRGADQVPTLRCLSILHGIVVAPLTDTALDRSGPFIAATGTIESWEKEEQDEDERLPMLRAVARSEFGRRGYEATTVRDIAAAAGLSVGSVYRLIGSKDELLASIMRTFTVKARSGWTNVLRSEGGVDPRVAAGHREPRCVVLGAAQRPQVPARPRHQIRRAAGGGAFCGHTRLVALRAPLDAGEHRPQARRPRRTDAGAADDAAGCGTPALNIPDQPSARFPSIELRHWGLRQGVPSR